MRSVVLSELRTDPVIADLPVPEPGDGEVLVRVSAAALNPFDLKVIDGALEDSVPHAFPLILGSDGAGIVEKVGPRVADFESGDRVFGQFLNVSLGRGSFSEFAVAPAARKLAPIPEGLSFTVAAALPTATLTAYQAVGALQLEPGQTVLVNGASGGVGQGVVQLASQAGAHVIATGTSDIGDYLRELGAGDVLDYTQQSPADYVWSHMEEGVDVVVDLVSKATEQATEMASLVRTGGVLLITNNEAVNAQEVTRPGVRGIGFSNKMSPDALISVAQLACDGLLRIRIDSEVPLPEAPGAITRARQGHSRGKTIIRIEH